MTPVMLGGVEAADVRVGGAQASAVYVGAEQVWPADTGGLPAYVTEAINLGAVFIQDGNLDVVSNTFLTGGSDPVAEVDGVKAWAGDWSFTLAAPVPADCTVVGLVRRNASSGYTVPCVWDGSNDTSLLGIGTQSLANTKAAVRVYSLLGTTDAILPRDETAWVPIGIRGATGEGGYFSRWLKTSGVWDTGYGNRNSYGGDKTIVSTSAAYAADDSSYVCGLAVFPTQLSDTQIQDLLALLPSAF